MGRDYHADTVVLFDSKWDDKLVTMTSDLLAAEIRPPSDGQSDTYAHKQTLAVSLFFKFYLNVQMKLHERQARILFVLI